MKGLRSIPRILKINKIDGYNVSCLFNNGESRVINFEDLFKHVFQVDESHIAYPLLTDYSQFTQIEVIGHSVGWPEIGIKSKDFEGKEVFYPYQPDPLVLYQNSTLGLQSLNIGMMVKEARKAAGMSQKELADKSGTSKHYISRLENNKSDIELLTLKKIVEAGLGRKLLLLIS
jgi:DNA-binding XRE family transcriptional regulator